MMAAERGSDGPVHDGKTSVTPQTERFVIRPDRDGYSVIDMWTGEAAIIAQTPQTGIPAGDAEHLAQLLNTRSGTDDRRVRT